MFDRENERKLHPEGRNDGRTERGSLYMSQSFYGAGIKINQSTESTERRHFRLTLITELQWVGWLVVIFNFTFSDISSIW